MIIYYNPDCSKCSSALDLLKENNCAVEIRNYLENPPSVEELRSLVTKLRIHPFDLVRTTEPLFTERFQGQDLSGEEWLFILSMHPVLIQRPIVIDGERAVIGRPPALVLSLIGE